MGDTPSLAYVLGAISGRSRRPAAGADVLCRAWDARAVFDTPRRRRPSRGGDVRDRGAGSIVRDRLRARAGASVAAGRHQEFAGDVGDDGAWRFRSSPKEATRSGLHDRGATIRACTAKAADSPRACRRRMARIGHRRYPNWWTDDPAPAERREASGAKTISRWREQFLRDFATRLRRAQLPASMPTAR